MLIIVVGAPDALCASQVHVYQQTGVKEVDDEFIENLK